jgi:threonyl-tRNA synthetase
MSEISILLPDGSKKIFDHEPTALEVALSIGPRLAKDTLGAKINGLGEIQDLRTVLPNNTKIELITIKSPEAEEVIRHSAAHVMAQAVQRLWPEVKVTIGPVVESGFYYDFDSPFNFTEDHFPAIEKEMQKIVDADYPLVKKMIPKSDAVATFKKMGERFKVELIEELKDGTISIYSQGEDWFDLCRGPHVQSTGQIKAFKLLSVAGAYWRANENNPSLQRIYATAFRDKAALENHLKNLEEAKKRDHRKLGKELGLFIFNELAPGSPFFTSKGTIVYNELQKFIREKYRQNNYQEVITPQIFDVNLFKTSGHYQNYKDDMYFMKADEREFGVKPMNCPSHCLIFGATHHSYKDLPVRMADFGRLHRYEKSGAMSGLTRVRTFCQDDAHVFCTMDQFQSEIQNFMNLFNEVYNTLGMTDYKIGLSTRPESRMGSDDIWDKAEEGLAQALKNLNLKYVINPGDGAFYGPKLDFQFTDAIGRQWQLGTLQADFNLPLAFNLKYVGEDNAEHKPVILHRAILGSLERFIGVYLEHTAGHLPTWLSPAQVIILNITDRVNPYCESVMQTLFSEGYRVEFDRKNEKLNYKIREAQLQKIPYMVIVGDKEAEERKLTLRLRDGSQKTGVTIEEFLTVLKTEVGGRLLTSPFKTV